LPGKETGCYTRKAGITHCREEGVVEKLIFPEQYFHCQNCSKCCSAKWTVTAAPEEEDYLNKFYRGSVIRRRQRCGESLLALKKNRGVCALLTNDRLCAVHASAGSEKKPLVCQLHPRSFLRTPDGIELIYSWDCPGVDWESATPPDDEEKREAARLADQLPRLTVLQPPFSCGPRTLNWDNYLKIREFIMTELMLSQFRVADTLKIIAGWIQEVGNGSGPLLFPDAEAKLDLRFISHGESNPLFARYLIAMLLLLPEEGPDSFSLSWSRARLLRLLRMLGRDSWWRFTPEGWRYPAAQLMTITEQVDPEAEQKLRLYLRELASRHLLARSEDIEIGFRLMVLLYRMTLVLAAACARRRNAARIAAADMNNAVSQIDRYYVLHLQVEQKRILGLTAGRVTNYVIRSDNFYASLW